MAVLNAWAPPIAVGARINSGHPAAHGLRACFLFNESGGWLAWDAVTGQVGDFGTEASTPVVKRSANPRGGEGIALGPLDGLGSGAYVSTPSLFDLTAPRITMVSWTFTGTGSQTHFCKQITGAGFPYANYQLYSSSTNKPTFTMGIGGDVRGLAATTSSSFRYVMSAGMYDGVRIRIAVDGRVEGSVAQTGNIPSSTRPLSLLMGESTGSPFIGWATQLMLYIVHVPANVLQLLHEDRLCCFRRP